MMQLTKEVVPFARDPVELVQSVRSQDPKDQIATAVHCIRNSRGMASLQIVYVVFLAVVGHVPNMVQLPASKRDGNVTVLVEQ